MVVGAVSIRLLKNSKIPKGSELTLREWFNNSISYPKYLVLLEISGYPLSLLYHLLSLFMCSPIFHILQRWPKQSYLAQELSLWYVNDIYRLSDLSPIVVDLDMGWSSTRSGRSCFAYSHLIECIRKCECNSFSSCSILHGWCSVWISTWTICLYS